MAAAGGSRIPVLPPSLEKDASSFRSVGRWWSEGACHWSQAPFLDVCLNENEPCLTKVDVDDAWPVCAHSGEEVLRLEPVSDVIQLLAVPGKENRARPWSVSYADNVALHNVRAVCRRRKRLIVPAGSIGQVRNRVLMETYALLVKAPRRRGQESPYLVA
jgi:hypothetical protein